MNMRPSDTAPAPAPDPQVHGPYHTDKICQGHPSAAFAKADQTIPAKNLADLYLNYLAEPSQDRRDELMKGCLQYLGKKVGYHVHCEGICPAHLAPGTFAQDALSRACYKFWTGIHRLRSPEFLTLWLSRVARSAVIEELREVIRRTKEPSSWTPVETVHADGDVTSIIDRAENRDAARRYGCVTVGQTQVLRDLVYRDLLGKLFSTENCSDEDIELLKAIHAKDLTADEIAEQRGMTRDAVLRRVRRARRRLREIAKIKYLFTVEDL